MDIIKDGQTEKWIIKALLELMEEKEYADITITEITKRAQLGRRTFYRYFKSKDQVLEHMCNVLMQEFAEKCLEKAGEMNSLSSVAKAYFELWEEHIDFLKLLKKEHLLYFIQERIEIFVHNAAVMAGHVPQDDKLDKETYGTSWYEYIFKVAGFWRLTTEWCDENPRKTPEDMAKIVTEIIEGQQQ